MRKLTSLAAKLFDFRDERVWLLRARLLWVSLALAAGVKTYLNPARHSVYLYFPRAAQHWWADLDLYANYAGFDPYRYSPTFAVAATPFGMLSDQLGGLLWVWGSVALLVWAFHAFVRQVLPGTWPPGREAWFLALSVLASIGGIWSAQSNALVLALVLFALIAIRQERWWRAAWLLALPVFIKLWPLAVFLLLIVRWGRPLLARFAVACAVLAAVPFCTRPWPIVCRQYATWYATLTGPLQARWGGYRDAWTIWEELWPPVSAHGYTLLQLATAAAVFGWCVWQSRRRLTDQALLTLVLASWSSWQLLFGPGTERLTYGLIAPAQAWAVLVSFRERRLRVLSLAAFTLTGWLSMGDCETAVERLATLCTGNTLHAPMYLPLGIALFAAWVVAYAWRCPAPTAAQPAAEDASSAGL